MATEIDDERPAGSSDERPAESPDEGGVPVRQLPGVDVPGGSDAETFVAEVLLERVGDRAKREFGATIAAIAARRIAQRRLGGREPASPDRDCREADVDPIDVVTATSLLRAAISPPADPAVVDAAADRLETCRAVLLATARDRAGPPMVTEDLRRNDRGQRAAAGDDVDVDPLPPDRSAEALKRHYHRLQSDLLAARLGFELHEYVIRAANGEPNG